jgi:NDP-sugar pyrophosphorylase family protein
VKAIVLCAGYGTRMGDLTRYIPKPMLPLQGQPLLAYTLRYLAAQGCADVAINLHYLPEQITTYFGDGSRFGVALHYSYEPCLLGTAGAVKNLEPWLGGEEDFVAMYGDILTDQNLPVLYEAHRRNGATATILLHQRSGSTSVVQIDESGRITGFIERPTAAQTAAMPTSWANSSVYVLNKRILGHIPTAQPADFGRDVFARMAPSERLQGVALTGYRCAIDSPARYREADAAIAEGRYRLPCGLSTREPTPTKDPGAVISSQG